MNIMAELAEAWSTPRTTVASATSGLPENPLWYIEHALHQARRMIAAACRIRNSTFAQLIDDAWKADPRIVERYFELSDGVVREAYGKWCKGAPTPGEYDSFCRMVDELHEITAELIKLVERTPP
jgi:hypothetical protein